MRLRNSLTRASKEISDDNNFQWLGQRGAPSAARAARTCFAHFTLLFQFKLLKLQKVILSSARSRSPLRRLFISGARVQNHLIHFLISDELQLRSPAPRRPILRRSLFPLRISYNFVASSLQLSSIAFIFERK